MLLVYYDRLYTQKNNKMTGMDFQRIQSPGSLQGTMLAGASTFGSNSNFKVDFDPTGEDKLPASFKKQSPSMGDYDQNTDLWK